MSADRQHLPPEPCEPPTAPPPKPSDLARDINSDRDPLDWFIEVCGVCGCQLGPGVGTRTRTGRCIYESHRSVGGIVVRVAAKPLSEQERRFPVLARLGVPDA